MLHDSVSRPSAAWVRPNACKPHNCAYESVCVFDWCFESFIVDGGWWLAWVVCVLMCMDIINKCVNYYVLSSDEKQIKKKQHQIKTNNTKNPENRKSKMKKTAYCCFRLQEATQSNVFRSCHQQLFASSRLAGRVSSSRRHRRPVGCVLRAAMWFWL